ncbi:MAG: DUF192 domain-containing protein [Candidatus Pacebacteria bacterium]|nr:DUF192 domain-containing protein [Candidatus Paceibacterota bacterium]
MNKKRLIFATGVALISLSFILVLYKTEGNVPLDRQYTLNLRENTINLEVASDYSLRIKGLSGRESLSSDTGMLFVFPEDGLHGIWMKDMNFSIDIIWLSSDFEVVNFKKHVSPDTYPTTFKPTSPARYVIEISNGSIDRFGIKIGEKLNVEVVEG